MKKVAMKLQMNLVRKIALFSIGWVAIHGLVQAGEAGSPRSVQLKVGTILATNEGSNFDPRLAPMKSQLGVFKYPSYRLLGEETKDVAWKESASFEVPGGRMLTLISQDYRDGRISLKVRLMKGEQPFLDTAVRLRSGGRFLLGGPAHDGGVLILSIGASVQ